jgi:hypothetical protein
VSLSLSQLATHAAKALQQAAGPVTLAYAWPHGWNGSDTIHVDGRVLPLRHCDSPLEVREALSSSVEGSRVLLVSIPENRLGQDVLGRLFRHRLLHVDRWQLVQDAFDVRQIDPRLFSLGWMPEMLLASTPGRRTSTAAVLTYDEAIQSCLMPVLGVASGSIDLESLLLACERGGQRWSEVSAEPRELFGQYLTAHLGSLASALLAALEAGNGHAVLGIGLVCEILYAPISIQTLELRDARVRLEQRLKGYRLKEADGKQWADIAKRLIGQRDPAARQHDFRLAVELLDAIGASEFVGLSSVLPEALEDRLAALGDAVTRFLRSPEALPEVEAAAQQVLGHQLQPTDHPGPECARMVVRLCRHEARLGASGPAADLVKDYLSNGAWEDWARRMLRGARPEALARAVTKLLDRIGERRMGSDEAFATAIARAAAVGDVPAGLVPIESTLQAVVAPLAQHNPLLMVVMDGMSQDVYLAIAESMAQRGWIAWSRKGLPLALLATIPSVTECSRASLLSGRLTRGIANHEKQAFTQHEGLKRTSKAAKPPVLLHKAGLEQSHQLTPEASSAIADPEQRIVGVVINAIDDALAKSEQVRIGWTMESIPLLVEVLEHARRAGRTVVLTSDHGHVLERQSTLRPDGEGERWRRPGRAIERGEIAIAGPRISALMGDALVLPWSENIRYAVKKNGYHGGVCRQELLVPIGIWTAGDQPEAEAVAYQTAYPVAPAWWGSTDDVVSTAVRAPTRRSNGPAAPTDDLFSMAPVDDWLDRFMASPLLHRQRERVGRVALEPERLRILLGKLQQQCGRCSIEQLASAIGQPVMRMRGVISVMERMLNLDGFPIITLEQGTGTVLLDIPLLKTQFLA